MKHGNFVGQGWLPFDKKEAEQIKLHLKSQLMNKFGKDFFKRFSVKIDNKDEDEHGDESVKHIIVRATLRTPFNGRNWFNSRITDCTDVWFFITKDKKGYLEIHDPNDPYNVRKYKRDYDNCPDFSYGCSMHASGTERKFRCRNTEGIQNWSPYVYGTEIKDLTYSDRDMEGLRKAITRAR